MGENIFSIRLKALRSSKKLSQAALGEIVGLKPQAINDMEHGRIKTTIDRVILFANYFNVSLDYLVGRTDEASVTAIPQTVQPQAEPLSGQENALLDSFRALNDADKMRVIQYTLNIRDEVEKKTSRTSDPVVG